MTKLTPEQLTEIRDWIHEHLGSGTAAEYVSPLLEHIDALEAENSQLQETCRRRLDLLRRAAFHLPGGPGPLISSELESDS